LTPCAGFLENGSHDEAPIRQRRFQTPGCRGIHRWRDTALPLEAARHLATVDPIWVGKFEAGALDDDVQAANLIQEYEAKIAALERMIGRQALEIERGFETCSPAEKRDWLRRHRPCGITLSRGCEG
jgi:hypothetical protein